MGFLAPLSAHEGVDDTSADEAPGHQHGGQEGHLPASAYNVEPVGQLEMASGPEAISDVAAYGDYAYVGAFAPECPSAGGSGGGVHVVNIADPTQPTKVGFLPAEPNSYVGEGVQVFTLGERVVLVHNNETCDRSQPATSGVSVWDVTIGSAPRHLGQVGDSLPAVSGQTYHQTHSAQGFSWRERAYAVATDNNERRGDIDIFDITPLVDGTGSGVLVSETGIENFAGAVDRFGYGMELRHHDMQQKVINGHNLLLVSYWDAGQLLLNIDDPAQPKLVANSDWSSPDPLFGSFATPEGNSHQSYWSADGRYVLSADEDFDPERIEFSIADGPATGTYWAAPYSWTRPLPSAYPDGFSGGTVYGGSGCTQDVDRNGKIDRREVPRQKSTGVDAVVFAATGCAFSAIMESGALAGYPVVLIAAPHASARGGLTSDAFFCGRALHRFDTTSVSGFCTGHRQLHLIFDDPVSYDGPNLADMPSIGTKGRAITLRGAFDGWGYVHLHDGATLSELDTYTIAEAVDPAYGRNFGDLTVHEVKTDPRRGKNLAYASWYAGGVRVLGFGPAGITELGHYIADGGSNFWGVFPHLQAGAPTHASGASAARPLPLILASDRDYGLMILRYTGRE